MPSNVAVKKREYVRRPLAERFSEKILIGDDCWEWSAHALGAGYGQINLGAANGMRQALAHRVSYELFRGPIPKGLCVCHHCDNPGCVKPSHLFLGTLSDNTLDAVAKGRMSRGTKNPNVKLSESDVAAIRDRAASGEKQKVTAAHYGVSVPLVQKIKSRRLWSWL